jgi:glycerol-3-phosphate acyltransferase PlsY
MIIGLIVILSLVHFPDALKWLYRQYNFIDGQLAHSSTRIRMAKLPFISTLGYILEFAKGVLLPTVVSQTTYSDAWMMVALIALLSGSVLNVFNRFSIRNHEWLGVFLGVLYFLNPPFVVIFLVIKIVVMVLSNAIPWSDVVGVIVTSLLINQQLGVTEFLYYISALIPLSFILSIQLYEYHTLDKGCFIQLNKWRRDTHRAQS